MRFVLFTFIFITFSALSFPIGTKDGLNEKSKNEITSSESEQLYDQMNLKELIHFDAFKAAYTGYKKLNKDNNPLLTLIDFNLPSSEKECMFWIWKRKRCFLFRMYHMEKTAEKITQLLSQTGMVLTKVHWVFIGLPILIMVATDILCSWTDWKKESMTMQDPGPL